MSRLVCNERVGEQEKRKKEIMRTNKRQLLPAISRPLFRGSAVAKVLLRWNSGDGQQQQQRILEQCPFTSALKRSLTH